MSATLLEIKSKHLLPRDEELQDVEDEEQRLIRQIEEYKLFKEQSEKLAVFENVNRFYKAPDNSVGEFRYELPDRLSMDSLIDAFKVVMPCGGQGTIPGAPRNRCGTGPCRLARP